MAYLVFVRCAPGRTRIREPGPDKKKWKNPSHKRKTFAVAEGSFYWKRSLPQRLSESTGVQCRALFFHSKFTFEPMSSMLSAECIHRNRSTMKNQNCLHSSMVTSVVSVSQSNRNYVTAEEDSFLQTAWPVRMLPSFQSGSTAVVRKRLSIDTCN